MPRKTKRWFELAAEWKAILSSPVEYTPTSYAIHSDVIAQWTRRARAAGFNPVTDFREIV